MTRKIDSTTARVVRRPTLSAEPVTCMPRQVPMRPMMRAKNGALTMPTQKVWNSMLPASRVRKVGSDRSSMVTLSSAAPNSPTRSAISVSSGSTSTSASRRGTTRISNGSSPMVRRASISSLLFITPISAAKALPERPATMMAVSSTPISRSTEIATRSMV